MIKKILTTLFLAILLPVGISAQQKDDTAKTDDTKTTAAYVFPTAKQRFGRFVNDTVGPGALVGVAMSATFQHIDNDPPEWKKNGNGFARRLGSNLGRKAIQESFKYGVSEAFRQDPAYRKCDCKKVSSRVVYALKSGFTARNRDGKEVFSVAKVAAPFVGNVAVVKLWFPERFTVRDGMRTGARSFGFGLGFNLIREFFFKK